MKEREREGSQQAAAELRSIFGRQGKRERKKLLGRILNIASPKKLGFFPTKNALIHAFFLEEFPVRLK